MGQSQMPPAMRRALLLTGGTLGRVFIGLFFSFNLLVGAVAHLNLEVSRRAAAHLVVGFVSDSLRGTIRVGSFSRLQGDGITAENIKILDPDGRTTLQVQTLSVEVDVLDILQRVFSDNEKLSISVEVVRAQGCKVFLLPTKAVDEAGQPLDYPSIADAFEPVEKEATKKKKESRPVRVWFPRIELEDVYARGNIAGSPTLEARVNSARSSVLATEKGAAVDINRFDLRLSGIGGVDAEATGAVHIRAPGAVWGNVDGKFGQIPLAQEFRFEEGVLDVQGEFPELAPAAVRPLFAAWPLDQPIAVENHVRGELPRMNVEAEILQLAGEESRPPTKLDGQLTVSPEFSADLSLVTDDLDLHGLMTQLPPSRLDSKSKVRIRQSASGVNVEFDSHIDEGTVAGQPSPDVTVEGSAADGGVQAKAVVREPGLSATVHGSYSSDGAAQVSATLDEVLLSENARLARLLGARGRLQGSVEGSLQGGTLSGSADLEVEDFGRDGISFARGSAKGTLSGRVTDPLESNLGLDVNLTHARLGPARLESARIQSTGPVMRPGLQVDAQTEAGYRIQAESDSNLETPQFSNLSASVTGKGKPIEISANRLSLAGSRIVVDDFELKSLGEIRGDIDWGDAGGTLDLEAEGLSISRISRALGLPRNEYGGDLNANIDMRVGQTSEGTLDLTIENGALRGIDGLSVDAHVTVDGADTQGNINASIARLGDLQSSWQLQLGGPLLRAQSYERCTGAWTSTLRNLDLRALSTLLGDALGVPEVSGELTSSLELRRDSPTSIPAAELSFETERLTIPLEFEDEKVVVRGIDVDGGVTTTPTDGQLEGALRLNDSYGTLASLSGTIDLPLAEWGRQLPDRGAMVESIRTASIDAVLVAARRPFRRWPGFLPAPLEEGAMGVRASATGTIESPIFSFVLDGRRLQGEASPFSNPVTVDLNARYRADVGSLRGNLAVKSDGDRLGSTQLDLRIPFEHLSHPPEKGVPWWTGVARVQLDNAPLEILEVLEERKMRGTAQGFVAIERADWDVNVSGELRLRSLHFGGHHLGDAKLEAHTYDSDLVTRAQFTDEYGSLRVTGETGIVPTQALFELDTSRSIRATLESDRYDAAVALPFASELLDELNGSLSGKIKATFAPQNGGTWSTELAGKLAMTDGVISPSALGMRMEDARLTVSARREGQQNVIRVSDISARVDSKRTNLEGSAIVYLKDLELQGATFHLSSDDVPLKTDGSELARLTGTAQGRLDMTGETTRLHLTINNMLATLPEAADTNLYSVDENPDIVVVQEAAREEAEERSKQEESSPVEIKFSLGNNMRVKSEFLDLKLRGDPMMRLEEEMQMGGSISLIPGGRIIVLGRSFRVEQGAILFDTGDPSDPHVSASATWKAPNGVLVRVTASGTAHNMKLEWSSEPALTGGEAEVIALVLGGGGGSGGGSGGQTQAGISTGIAYAANEALGQTGLVSGVEFYTTQQSDSQEGRVASLNEQSMDSYTAAFRISDELWFEGSYEKLGGVGLHSEARSGVSGTLDWRFHPNWSIRTELGMLGTGLDLVWRYRY